MALKDLLTTLTGNTPVVLELDLARGVLTARPSSPLQAVQLINSPTLEAVRVHLAAAATDDRVLGLIVHATPTGMSIAHAEEIADLIEKFGRSKPTMAWAESYGELAHGIVGYHIAAAARQVWVQPTGMLAIDGLELGILLLRGLLEKAGVEPQFGQRHEYKTAADQYQADHVTDANREMMTRLGASFLDTIVTSVARRRGIAVEQVRDGVSGAPVEPARALELGLIDHVGYRDEAYAAVLREWNAAPENLLYVHRYTNRAAIARNLRPGRDKVAVVTLRGAIVTGRGARSLGGQSAGSDVIDEQLRTALRDDNVKAVVFSVDSPGGSAVASDFIRRGVVRLKEAGKPVVAQMGSYAASGGYYVSMAANEIVAHATTLTGSIGVLAGKMVTAGLYDKLGLIRESLTFGEAAGTFSAAQAFTEADWERLNRWLDRIYLDFTTLAAGDRGLDYEDLESKARGRVWTGADAVERGLVDHIGGLGLAIERACDLAGLDRDRISLSHVGSQGMLSTILPANSSERATGGAELPTTEALLTSMAARVGLVGTGALSMPLVRVG